MDEIDLQSLSPGIRRTVAFLRSEGFETTDSGDGHSNMGMECAMPFPNVAIRCPNPENLVSEARRLQEVLAKNGVMVEPLGPDDPEVTQPPHIEATYDPSNDIGFILLMYVDDQVLFREVNPA